MKMDVVPSKSWEVIQIYTSNPATIFKKLNSFEVLSERVACPFEQLLFNIIDGEVGLIFQNS